MRRVNFKIYDVANWETTNCDTHITAIHIMPNISRSKGYQTMKFGQLIECNIRSIFLEKSYTKSSGKTSPRPFSKTSLYLSINSLTFYIVCFYCISKLRAIEIR